MANSLKMLAIVFCGVMTSLPAAADTNPPNNVTRSTRGDAGKRLPSVSAPMPAPVEQVFVPITPCRAFVTDTVIKSGKTRTFQISGSSDLSGQGGPAAGCGVPASATAIGISLTAIEPSAAGYLKAFAVGSARPAGSVVQYVSATATAGSIVALNSDGLISVYLNGGSSRVAGDITGYFAPQIQVYMNYDGTAYAATSRIVATEKTSTGNYRIEVDRNLQLCSVHVNVDGGKYYATAYPSGNFIYVNTWQLSGGTPADIDLYHNVSAKC